MTPNEREAAFRKDLTELLKKHRAEINITDDGKPYGMHMPIVEIDMGGSWDEDGNPIDEYTSFRL